MLLLLINRHNNFCIARFDVALGNGTTVEQLERELEAVVSALEEEEN